MKNKSLAGLLEKLGLAELAHLSSLDSAGLDVHDTVASHQLGRGIPSYAN